MNWLKRNLVITEEQPLPSSASVLGLGKTGISVSRYLANSGVDVLASDASPDLSPSALNELSAEGIAVELGANRVREGDLVVISPGIPPDSPVFQEARKLGADVISEPELFGRRFGRPILAVTGTDGKSTVTTWLAHILSEAGLTVAAGGNLGNPLVDELGRNDLDLAVVEISAFQLITTETLSPALAIITNIADDHLDYFGGNRDAYIQSKRHLLELCREGSFALSSETEAVVRSWPVPHGVNELVLGERRDGGTSAWVEGDMLTIRPPDAEHALPLIEKSALPLPGEHNVVNALFAALAAAAVGTPVEAIRSGLLSYTGLPHRCAPVMEVGGIRFINDSKATSPNATAAALTGIHGPIVLIAGGSDKGADFSDLGVLISAHTRAVVLCGETSGRLKEAIYDSHPVFVVESLEKAVSVAYEQAKPGDCVLLSPACASFDLFQSFAHRGETFEECVHRLLPSTSD